MVVMLHHLTSQEIGVLSNRRTLTVVVTFYRVDWKHRPGKFSTPGLLYNNTKSDQSSQTLVKNGVVIWQTQHSVNLRHFSKLNGKKFRMIRISEKDSDRHKNFRTFFLGFVQPLYNFVKIG